MQNNRPLAQCDGRLCLPVLCGGRVRPPRRFGDNGNQVVGLDERAVLVDEHRAVGIAVENDAAVKPLVSHARGDLRARLSLERIRRMVRERPIQRVVEHDRARKQVVHEQRRHAVRAVDGEAEPVKFRLPPFHPVQIARAKVHVRRPFSVIRRTPGHGASCRCRGPVPAPRRAPSARRRRTPRDPAPCASARRAQGRPQT